MKFKVHTEGVALEAQVRAKLWHRFEVQSVGAVVLTRHGDVLAVEHLRIAPGVPGYRLDECVVRVAGEELIDGALLIELQNALIILTRFHLAVAVQNGLNVTAQVCVGVPTVEVGLL